MRLAIGQDADLLQVQLGVVPPLMLSGRSGLGTDYNLSMFQVLFWNIQDLLEVSYKGVVLVYICLNFLKDVSQHLFLRFACIGRDGHILIS